MDNALNLVRLINMGTVKAIAIVILTIIARQNALSIQEIIVFNYATQITQANVFQTVESTVLEIVF